MADLFGAFDDVIPPLLRPGAWRAGRGVPLERGVYCTYLLFVTNLVALAYLQSSGPRSRF